VTRAIPTPLHRDAALAHESHRHELLDPTTLRWVAELLVELEHLPCAQVAEHLQLVAQTAGRAIDVHWRRDGRLGARSGSGAHAVAHGAIESGIVESGIEHGTSNGSTRRREEDEPASELTSARERSREARRVVSAKRMGGSGRTPALATEATQRVSR
jgi:hypothetical protein